MELVLNEEQIMLKDTAAGFLSEKAPVDQLRALRDSGDKQGFSIELWQEMVEMGWAAIAIPEAHGGLGYGYIGLGLVLEQVGRNLTASPLQSSILIGATMIESIGSDEQQAEWLPQLAAGETKITLALQEGNHHHLAGTAAAAVKDGVDYVLNGEKTMVMDATSADQIVVVARTSGDAGDSHGLSAFLVPADAAGLTVSRRQLVDSRNYGAVTLNDVHVPVEQRLGEEGAIEEGLARTIAIANIGLSAEMLGLSLEAFEFTVGYLKERKQFDRTIGSFQALQHRASRQFVELELARSLVLKALLAIDAGDDLSIIASATKAKLCEVTERVTNETIQMHGGIGMTDEYNAGFYLKRARVLQHLFGNYTYHMDQFAIASGF